jgi:hypothetical protein
MQNTSSPRLHSTGTQQTSSFWMYVFFIIFLGVLGLVGYGAYSLLSNPAHYAEEIWEKTRETKKTPEETPIDNSGVVIDEKPIPTEKPVTPEPKPTGAVNLSDKIDGLITRNVTLKAGSRGADVGVIQEFMNQYYKRNDKIDNDFGPGLTTLVKKFQVSQKLPNTGQVAARTLAAMKKLAK